MRAKPAGQCGNPVQRGNPVRYVVLAASVLALIACSLSAGFCQQPSPLGGHRSAVPSAIAESPVDAGAFPSSRWEGLPVRRISFEGVAADRLKPLPGHLPQAEGAPLDEQAVRRSLRQLFATGLYDSIEADAENVDGGVALTFRGAPRTFIGIVSVDGAKGATMNTQLQRASQLSPGARYTQSKLAQALDEMRHALADNGFHQSTITENLIQHPAEQLVDIAFHVASGPRTRVGSVEVSGEPGMSADEFRRYAHLRLGAQVDHDTANRALDGVLNHYRHEQRLEADVKLESPGYSPATNRTSFHFSATQGPVVKVLVQGAAIGPERIKHVIPIYEEGTVDEDLLIEGNRRLRDYFQRLGFFDVKVDHQQQNSGSQQVTILYRVQLGSRRHVYSVTVAGNRYFDAATLKQLLGVHAADSLDRHGAYSQGLVSADIAALQAVYQNNGFSKVKIVAETNTPETGADQTGTPGASSARTVTPDGTAPLSVVYRIEEGIQQRVGSVQIDGAPAADQKRLSSLLNTTAGQLLSPQNLAGDRDALLTDYLSRGFEHPSVDIVQQADPSDPNKVDVDFRITPGLQVFVRNVLFTGLHYTRPDTAAKAITIHAGDPLNQSALMETQRNLYEFALFNEVDTAVQNPNGANEYKTVLLQAIEARRWALTYGFGFEAQTGQPQTNCAGDNTEGVPCSPNGKTGVSPRVLIDITRNNLGGREQSASVRATYGLLEQKIDLLFQVPRFENNRNFSLSLSAGYANSQDVTTYVASRLESVMRVTEHFLSPNSFLSKANNFEYGYNFRRVKVESSSLQVAPYALTELSTATRVGGPSFTWVRDTRDSPLDSHRGSTTSFQEFLSAKIFGAEAQFNRIDLTNSSFYSFDKGRFVLARNTRYGQERVFGKASNELLPLPERLYAGGANSLRGFSINAAGPRDPETGYPIGGAGALINSTELRLPPPTLPGFGNTLSFVLFHDMGNVFTNAGDAWASAARIHQPDRTACEQPIPVTVPPSTPGPPNSSTGPQGSCSFNYFSHAPGLGLRYHTPVGPIRLDFSYNLNPPIYPVTYNYSLTNPASPHVGQAGHFNFFFSLGEAF